MEATKLIATVYYEEFPEPWEVSPDFYQVVGRSATEVLEELGRLVGEEIESDDPRCRIGYDPMGGFNSHYCGLYYFGEEENVSEMLQSEADWRMNYNDTTQYQVIVSETCPCCGATGPQIDRLGRVLGLDDVADWLNSEYPNILVVGANGIDVSGLGLRTK